jgi:hypothetical protein
MKASLFETEGFNSAQVQFAAVAAPILVDSQAALPDEIWIVESCNLIGIDTQIENPNPGVTGIWLCPSGTGPGDESPAGAIQLPISSTPLSNSGTSFTSTGTATVLAVLKRFIVPPNCFLRGVFDFSPAGPAGTGTLTLSFTYKRHKICGG